MTLKDAKILTEILNNNFEDEEEVEDMIDELNKEFPKFVWVSSKSTNYHYIGIIVQRAKQNEAVKK